MKISTINRGEIDKFSKIANEWWDPEGKFKPLHKFNPIRIQYIKENSLQNKEDRRFIIPDDKLGKLLGVSNEDKLVVNYFNLQRFMNKHFIKIINKEETS